MNINRDNYEAYFLDFIEGRLSPEEEEVLRRFLQFNPDLEEELNTYELHEMLAEKITFPLKDSMKKEMPGGEVGISESNFEMYCIAYLEGDLDSKQKAIFEQYLLDHTEKREELNAFRGTFLQPEKIQFPQKSRLKRRKLIALNWRILVPVASAAAIALLFFIQTPEQNVPIEIASTTAPEENERESEMVREEPKPSVQPAQATFNVVRKASVPVPVSDYKEKQEAEQEKQMQKMLEKGKESAAIASVSLRKQQFESTQVSYDRIELESIEPPTINSSSLSILELARYQAQRVSKVMEEEDALIWSLASNGLQELNRIAGSNTELIASRDEDGAISGFRFRSRFLNVSAPLPRNE